LIVAIGEVLIDFIGQGELSEAPLFRKCFGGAPANVARGVARLGGKAGIIARISSDGFGRFLHDALKDSGVDVRGVVSDPKRKTRLAFVSVRGNGEREFSFYSENCADEALGPDDVRTGLLNGARVLHFGSIGLMSGSGEGATRKAARIVREGGGKISYDPNLRPMLWKSEKEMRRKVMRGLELADIMKVDRTELEFITGEKDVGKAVRELPELELVCITLGRGGCYYYSEGKLNRHPGYRADAVDSTGAGDAFVSGLLFGLVSGKGVVGSVGLANAVGAVSTFNRFPTLARVKRFAKVVG
jgi:fructokinase